METHYPALYAGGGLMESTFILRELWQYELIRAQMNGVKVDIPAQMKAWDESRRKRGKTSAASNAGSFAPAPATLTNTIFKEVTPQEFLDAQKGMKRTEFLTPYSPQDLAHHRCYLSEDGKTGYTLSPEDDLQNVFNNGGRKGAGQIAIIDSIKNGAKTLDCFDEFLPRFYAEFGFVETGRVKFDDEFAPDGWNYKDGRPDIVFMTYDGGDRGTIENRIGTFEKPHEKSQRYFTDWDSAKADSRTGGADRPNDGRRDNSDGGTFYKISSRTDDGSYSLPLEQVLGADSVSERFLTSAQAQASILQSLWNIELAKARLNGVDV